MPIYLTNNFHFYHKVILRLGYRPCENVDGVVSDILTRWNVQFVIDGTVLVLNNVHIRSLDKIEEEFQHNRNNSKTDEKFGRLSPEYL